MHTVQLNPIHDAGEASSDDDDCLQEEMAEEAELEYFCQASQAIMLVKSGGLKTSAAPAVASKTLGNEEFIGLNPETKEEDETMAFGEVEKLREENKRLKKTLAEKFQSEAD